MTQPDPLSPYYYHHNFQSLMDLVSERDWDLLTEQERIWITTFQQLSFKAQCLLIRLLMRRHDWFVAESLFYPELGETQPLLNVLAEQKFVSITHSAPANVLLNLLSKSQLIAAFPAVILSKSARKKQWQAAIIETYGESLTSPYSLVVCHHPDILAVLLLLYFGNSRQDLSQFVVAELGIQRFESYPIRRAERLFQHRRHIDDWLHLSALNEMAWQARKAKRPEAILALKSHLPEPFDWSPLERKRQRLANRIAREFERQGDLLTALSLYQTTTQPPSQERQARILIKQGEIEAASNIIATMIRVPHDEEELDVAYRLAKQKPVRTFGNLAPSALVRQPALPTQTLTLPLNQRVENEVADHYRQQGWQVWYSENSLLNALFGLFFWDILFLSVRGAFLNPFQRGPRDLYSDDFITQRQSQIDARLAEIGRAHHWVAHHYQQKQGINNDWVNWSVIEWPLLEAALSVLTESQLTACFARILFDRQHNRRGHPDLFMCQGTHYQWVEVKGPGDVLQPHQTRWLQFFLQHHIPAKVTYVTPLE
ncbi:VRR-NUC domain-containing protein [Salinivibrio sp. ES.052]|uniref:VRR-NUC domain-containing protein n=1 Tax=Salinivibrio sp. ES.052 TaxID=1882823 RepID=UPI00092AB4BF|nr:VRR-NUC domain-containing protein [Salinivibrio sp. ES.052]SIN82107.1 VRR-NUC domain-containing protein [Salinivibrio sp. ES.052]